MTTSELFKSDPKKIFQEIREGKTLYFLAYELNNGENEFACLSVLSGDDELANVFSPNPLKENLVLISKTSLKKLKEILNRKKPSPYKVIIGKEAYQLFVSDKTEGEAPVYSIRPNRDYDMLLEWYEQKLKEHRNLKQSINPKEE